MLTVEQQTELSSVRGVVFDVQRYSVHDGPGLRTNVFLKGCALRCGWCANPESQHAQPEPALRVKDCIECGQFESPCAACWAGWQSNRADAAVQFELTARTAVCPTGALYWTGASRTAGDVFAEVLRDRPFYGDGGGLTLTGGEPTMQPAFSAALLQLARDAGIATAMETCGHTQWAVYERLAPLLDMVLFDIKHMDPVIHQAYTGMDNRLILANVRQLVAQGTPVRIRIPLIPGFNATPAALGAILDFVGSLPGPVLGVDLLPYHTLGKAKYAALGREYPWRDHARLLDGEVKQLAQLAASTGLKVTVGG